MPTAHEIDYAIRGHEMHFVEIELDPGAGGTLIERELKAGEELHVDTGCLVALSQTVDYDVVTVGGVKSMIFGGEGVFFARLRGPGHVWLQSLPFSRLAGRIMANIGPAGRRTDEGSVLGVLGNIIQGR